MLRIGQLLRGSIVHALLLSSCSGGDHDGVRGVRSIPYAEDQIEQSESRDTDPRADGSNTPGNHKVQKNSTGGDESGKLSDQQSPSELVDPAPLTFSRDGQPIPSVVVVSTKRSGDEVFVVVSCDEESNFDRQCRTTNGFTFFLSDLALAVISRERRLGLNDKWTLETISELSFGEESPRVLTDTTVEFGPLPLPEEESLSAVAIKLNFTTSAQPAATYKLWKLEKL